MRSRLWLVLPLAFALVTVLAPSAYSTPLTRQQAVAALFGPGSGIVLDTTVSTVWSPYFDFGSGPGFEGLVPGGSTVNPAFSGPGMAVATASYFFWVDDLPSAHFVHPVRFVLVDANNPSPTVANGGVQWTLQGWWPVITRPGNVVNTFFESQQQRATALPPGFGNPQGLIGGGASNPADLAPSHIIHEQAPARTEAGNPCAITVVGAPDPEFANDATTFINDTGVPAGRVKKANNGAPASRADLGAALRDLCTKTPACDKIYMYIGSHGNDGVVKLSDGLISAKDLCDSLKILADKKVPICLLVEACHSGSLLDPANWNFPDGSIVLTSASSTEDSFGGDFQFPDGSKGFVSLFPHAFHTCLHDTLADTNHDGKVDWAEAFQWIKKVQPCYTWRPKGTMYYPAGPPPLHTGADPGPKKVDVVVLQKKGDQRGFVVPGGTGSVCITFANSGNPGSCANTDVYCSADGMIWILAKHWNWNEGLTRYFTPLPQGGYYILVSDANNYPVRGGIQYLTTGVTEDPSSVSAYPGFTLGWNNDNYAEFSPNFPPGSGYVPVQVQPNLVLTGQVPAFLGPNTATGIDLQYNLQPDPSRPWLYIGGNPSAGYAGQTYLSLSLAEISDGFGNPVPSLPIQVTLTQMSSQRHYSMIATEDGTGAVTVPVQNLGTLMPFPFTLRIEPMGGFMASSIHGIGGGRSPSGTVFTPGTLQLDAVTLTSATPGTASAPDLLPMANALFFASSPAPNPSGSASRVEFLTFQPAHVTVDVFDVNGRRERVLVEGAVAPGDHSFSWDGRDGNGRAVSSGVYFARIRVGTQTAVRKMARIR